MSVLVFVVFVINSVVMFLILIREVGVKCCMGIFLLFIMN